MKRAVSTTLMAAGLWTASCALAQADGDFLDIGSSGIRNYLGGGIGGAPDFIGSDEYGIGGAPVGRYSFGERYIDIQANFLSVNLIENSNWRFGPAGVVRLGRRNVDDPVVAALPDVDYSLELGAFVGYQIVDEADPRDRWAFIVDATHDVTGTHGGLTVSASARRWIPVGDFAAVGLSLGTTFGSEDYMDTYFSVSPAGAVASGLAPYEAEAGFRDVRLSAVLIQPISEQWLLGGGLMYKRLVGDAADTPITDDRGSANQFIFGVGAAYMF